MIFITKESQDEYLRSLKENEILYYLSDQDEVIERLFLTYTDTTVTLLIHKPQIQMEKCYTRSSFFEMFHHTLDGSEVLKSMRERRKIINKINKFSNQLKEAEELLKQHPIKWGKTIGKYPEFFI